MQRRDVESRRKIELFKMLAVIKLVRLKQRLSGPTHWGCLSTVLVCLPLASILQYLLKVNQVEAKEKSHVSLQLKLPEILMNHC